MFEQDHTETAAKVLEAAAEEFAELGYDGARVDAIARRAGVNKATLYYQVGDKAALYGAVMERVLGTVAERAERAASDTQAPAAQLLGYVLALGADQDLLRLAAPILMREVASGGRNLPAVALAQMGRIIAALRRILAHGTEQGAFRPVNHLVVHMMVVGSLTFYAAGTPIRERIAREARGEFAPERFLPSEQAAESVAELVLASLAAGD